MKIISGVLLVLGFTSLWFFRGEAPVVRLALSSLGLIFVIKVAAFFWQKSGGVKTHSSLGLLLYFFAWPGISLRGFSERGQVPEVTGKRFLESWLTFLAGVALFLAAAFFGRGESTLWNYLALLSVLLIIHLGLVEAVADGIRLLGFSPASLFDRPLQSQSLRDFWSVRWNRAFVDMNRIFLLEPLRGILPSRVLVFLIFLLSGILHELAISYPAGASWGLPLTYFFLQALGMELERWRKFPRGLVFVWILAPLPLLFPPAFVNLFLGGAGRWLAALEVSRGDFTAAVLLGGGLLHFLVLCASVQVPGKLGWKEDFAKLRSLNRKVFWTYGAYIFSIILFMAYVSLSLSGAPLDPAGRLWVIFIALFWWARVLIDTLYFKHSDWPEGPLFVIGHICLTTLFICLAGAYTAVVILS